MTPPDGETAAADAAPGPQPSPSEADHAYAQSNEVPAAPESAQVTPSQSDDEETDDMVERLEDLILEAYGSMQSDGEYIFLPDEVAERLHRVADEMMIHGKQESGEGVEKEEEVAAPSAGQDSGSGDAAVEKAETVEVKEKHEVFSDRPEPEREEQGSQQEQEQDEKDNKQKESLQPGAAELRDEKQKQRIRRVHSTENLFTELAPVPEIDEESSGTPSPSPPLSRSHSGANTPMLRPRTPARDHGHFPPPPVISLSSTPSSVAASPDHIGKSPASRSSDYSGEGKRTGRVLTYEKRREAALKLKEDKKKRERRIRESANKQREDLKRQLEEAHQKEMEEKRERVRRIREERLHRRGGKTTPKSK